MTSKRRDALKALFIPDPSDAAPAPEPAARQRSGAVKAMGLSLAGMTAEIADARSLRRALEDGDRVVDVDTASIDAAFVADRLSLDERGDPAFAALVESMRGSGQQVPVLLRPHPEVPGRYQTAYGHRRIRAAARLGRPVRAIVRALSDEALVLAQGNENAERRDLSFIERALFARALVGRGFARSLVQDALRLHKSEMARLLQVAEAVPRPLALAIGPAPKAGRPRWLALAGRLRENQAEQRASEVIASDRFKAADSDGRFKLLYDGLADCSRVPAEPPKEVRSALGKPVALIAKARIDFVGSEGADFAAFVAAELPELFRRFEAGAAE